MRSRGKGKYQSTDNSPKTKNKLNKKRERGNSYHKNEEISGSLTDTFHNYIFVSQSEESKHTWTQNKDGAMWQLPIRAIKVGAVQEEEIVGDGGKIKWKLSEVNTRSCF